MESGQSQFAPLKLRSLALVPSSGARCAPTNSTPASSAVRLFPTRRSAPVIDSRALRGPASPVGMQTSVHQRKEVRTQAAVQSSGQPSAGLSPPGRFAPFSPIKAKRSRPAVGHGPPARRAGQSPRPPGAMNAREAYYQCGRQCLESAYINIIPSGLCNSSLDRHLSARATSICEGQWHATTVLQAAG